MNVTATTVVVATRPVDFRKGHDSLAAVVFRPKRTNFVSFHIPL